MRLLLCFWLILAAGVSAVYKAPLQVQKVFKAYNVVPQIIPVVPDSQLIVIYNNGGTLKPGDKVPATFFDYFPYMTWSGSEDEFYTFTVIDPDYPQVYTRNGIQYVTYLIVNIPGLNMQRGDWLTGFVDPSPLPGSGYHRYVSLIYKQEERINVTTDLLIRISTNPGNFSITEFVNEFQLGDPIAGNLVLSKSTLCEPKEKKYCNIDCQ